MTLGNKWEARNLEIPFNLVFAYGKTSCAADFFLVMTARLHKQRVQQLLWRLYHFTRRELPWGSVFKIPKQQGFATQNQSVPGLWKSPLDELFCIYIYWEARACLVWHLFYFVFFLFPPPCILMLGGRRGSLTVSRAATGCYAVYDPSH